MLVYVIASSILFDGFPPDEKQGGSFKASLLNVAVL